MGNTRFTGATIITGDGSTVIPEADLLVKEGEISALLRPGAVVQVPDLQTVDLSGRFLIPTLINAHGHLGYQHGSSTARENFSRESVLDSLRRLAYYGVGVIQSLGTDRDNIEIDIRNSQRSGELEEGLPLVLSASAGIVAPTPGGTNGGPFFASDVLHEANDAEHAVEIVRRISEVNPDCVKVWIDDRNGTKMKLAPAVYGAVISEARRLGIPVTAHVYELEDAKGAIRAGVDALAHLVRSPGPDDELIELSLAHRIHAFSSVSVQESFVQTDWLDDPSLAESVSSATRLEMRDVIEGITKHAPLGGEEPFTEAAVAVLRSSLMRNYRAGVPIVLSGDTGVLTRFFGYAEHSELEAMVRAGMTPIDAIASGTSIPANFLGLQDRGLLEVGRRADFIVLDGDPTRDIRATRRISDVYIEGRPLDRRRLRGTFTY